MKHTKCDECNKLFTEEPNVLDNSEEPVILCDVCYNKEYPEESKEDTLVNELPTFKPVKYINTPEHKATIEYGRYIVVRKDGKKHLETFNGTGWAYNHNSIVAYYLPKFD